MHNILTFLSNLFHDHVDSLNVSIAVLFHRSADRMYIYNYREETRSHFLFPEDTTREMTQQDLKRTENQFHRDSCHPTSLRKNFRRLKGTDSLTGIR